MTYFTSLSDTEFGALFVNFKSSAFRLETLQKYSVGYEEAPFLDFLAGKERYVHADQAEWANLIRKNIAAGKTMSRVHVVVEPISDYICFELLWPYPESVAAGEDVRILPTTQLNWPPELPHEAFWLFDSEHAAIMQYDDDGHFLRAQLTKEPARISQFLDWKDAAVKASIPYHNYVTRGMR